MSSKIRFSVICRALKKLLLPVLFAVSLSVVLGSQDAFADDDDEDDDD